MSYSLPKLAGNAATTLTPTASSPPRYEGMRPITASPWGSASIVRSGMTTSPPASMVSALRMVGMASSIG